MTITDRNLKPGTLLKATYKATEYLAEITTYEDEKNLTLNLIGIGPKDPQSILGPYSSLSKAAMAITGNSVNGWRFWSIAAPPAGKVTRGAELKAGPQNREPVEGKITDQDVIDRIDDILTTSPEALAAADADGEQLLDHVERTLAAKHALQTVKPREKRHQAAQEPAVANHTATVDLTDTVDTVAGVAQPTAAQDAGFGNGGTFTADAKRKAKQRSFSPIKRTAQQGGLEGGTARYWCHGCQASFIGPELEDVKADSFNCPAGHNVGDMREAALGNTGQED